MAADNFVVIQGHGAFEDVRIEGHGFVTRSSEGTDPPIIYATVVVFGENNSMVTVELAGDVAKRAIELLPRAGNHSATGG